MAMKTVAQKRESISSVNGGLVADSNLIIGDGLCKEIAGLSLGAQYEWVSLGASRNPLAAISNELERKRLTGQPVHTLHIVAHGRPGAFQIGGRWGDSTALIANAAQLAQWQVQSIALWSCEVAADTGAVSLFSELTGAEIWASAEKLGRSANGEKLELHNATQSEGRCLSAVIEHEHLQQREFALNIDESSQLTNGFITGNTDPLSGLNGLTSLDNGATAALPGLEEPRLDASVLPTTTDDNSDDSAGFAEPDPTSEIANAVNAQPADSITGLDVLEVGSSAHVIAAEPEEIAHLSVVSGSDGFDASSLANLTEAITATNSILTDLPNRTDYEAIIQNSFENAEDLESLAQQLGSDGLQVRVELRTNEELNGAKAAYAAIGSSGSERIYINRDWLQTGVVSQTIQQVLLEESGHAIDQRLNPGGDSQGDEGAIFAAQVLGLNLDTETIAGWRTEDDSAQLSLDGHIVNAELSGVNTDSDLVDDEFDLDDDNDGILDSVEQQVVGGAALSPQNVTLKYAQDSLGFNSRHDGCGQQGTGSANDPNYFFDGDVNTELRMHADDVYEFQLP